METRKLNELDVKTSFPNNNFILGILADGSMGKVLVETIRASMQPSINSNLPIKHRKGSADGINIIPEDNPAIVIASDNNNPANFLIYYYRRKIDASAHHVHIIASNNMVVKASNSVGTIVLGLNNTPEGYSPDITQHVIVL